MKRLLLAACIAAAALVPAGAAIPPSLQGYFQQTIVTASGTTLVATGPTLYGGVKNLSATAQTITITCYDNTVASGTVVDGPITLAANQVYLGPNNGMVTVTGLACALSGAAAGNGIAVYWHQ